jgi:hypothetical protein
VNLFKGRASDGRVYLDEGMQLDSSDARGAKDSQAFAYVRPHDLEVERYSPARISTPRVAPQASWPSFRAPLWSAPSQGWNLFLRDHTKASHGEDGLIEAQIPAQQFKDMGLREGETLVVTPRRAKVFLDEAAGIIPPEALCAFPSLALGGGQSRREAALLAVSCEGVVQVQRALSLVWHDPKFRRKNNDASMV